MNHHSFDKSLCLSIHHKCLACTKMTEKIDELGKRTKSQNQHPCHLSNSYKNFKNKRSPLRAFVFVFVCTDARLPFSIDVRSNNLSPFEVHRPRGHSFPFPINVGSHNLLPSSLPLNQCRISQSTSIQGQRLH